MKTMRINFKLLFVCVSISIIYISCLNSENKNNNCKTSQEYELLLSNIFNEIRKTISKKEFNENPDLSKIRKELEELEINAIKCKIEDSVYREIPKLKYLCTAYELGKGIENFDTESHRNSLSNKICNYKSNNFKKTEVLNKKETVIDDNIDTKSSVETKLNKEVLRAIDKFNIKYEELMNFRRKNDFSTYGFSIGGPYDSWKKQIDVFNNSKDGNLLFEEINLSPYLLYQMGMEYIHSFGEETDFTIWANKKIKRNINLYKSGNSTFTDYLDKP